MTDHKPLLALLGPQKGIPPLAAARLQRWAVLLSAYTYDHEFKTTQQHANADGLSRLPLKTTDEEETSKEATVFNISQLDTMPVTNRQLEQATRKDPILSKALHYTQRGWPDKVQEGLKPYQSRRLELSVEQNCLLWGARVVVPSRLRSKVMQEIHQNHPGVVRMKALARSYVWWPGIDATIESHVKSCTACQTVRNSTSVAPLHPWLWPTRPWQRIHLDFAGPFKGKMFLLVVDAHSKWPEIVEMPSTTSQRTIEELRRLFAAYGLPEQIVSDNGPQFSAEEFAIFVKLNGIKHIKCAPYHPSSNGAVERMVQTFKNAMKAGQQSSLSLSQQLASFLLTYRSTPHTTTNVTPCELFLKRRVRTRLDLLRPDCERRVCGRQAEQKYRHDQHAKQREMTVGQKVMAKNMRPYGRKWVSGVVVEKLGPLTYLVQVEGGLFWRRHVDLLREVSMPSNARSDQTVVEFSPGPPNSPFVGMPPEHEQLETESSTTPDSGTETTETNEEDEGGELNDQEVELPQRQYPQRNRRPPQRLASELNI